MRLFPGVSVPGGDGGGPRATLGTQKGAGREVGSLWWRGGVRGERARPEPGWGRGLGACDGNVLPEERRGLPQVLIPDDYLHLRGVVRRRVKGEGVEVAV